jgi:hypothetical protein
MTSRALCCASLLAVLVGCHQTPPTQAAESTMNPKVERIKQLVADLDKDADELHLDITPSVLALAEYGIDVIPYLHDALLAPELLTRMHAGNALARAVSVHCGFVAGKGWSRPDGEAESRALWIKNGSYDAKADEQARARSVEAWTAWYHAQKSN